MKIFQEQCARLAGDGGHGGNETLCLAGRGRHACTFGIRLWASSVPNRVQRREVKSVSETKAYFFFPPSSAMYMISCLKMKRLGAPSRVSRTMFLSKYSIHPWTVWPSMSLTDTGFCFSPMDLRNNASS